MGRWGFDAHTSEALVLLAQEVLYRYLDILKCDICGSGRPHTLAVHPPRRHTTRLPLDKQERNTVHAGAARPHGSREVVRPDTVGDPLLLAVDNVVLAVLAQLGLARQVGNVAARIRLSDGQADALVTVQDAGQDPVLEGLLAELDQRRAANAEAADDVPDETTGAGARQLVCDEHLVEEIPLLWRHRFDLVLSVVALERCPEQASQVAPTTHLLVDLGRDLLLLVPLGDVGLDLVLDPFANLGSEGGVGLVEEGGVELHHPHVSGELNESTSRVGH